MPYSGQNPWQNLNLQSQLLNRNQAPYRWATGTIKLTQVDSNHRQKDI